MQKISFRNIGALAPSFKPLALEMLRFVDCKKKQEVLEVGAGTGAITKHLIKKLGPKSNLDVVELVQSLVGILDARFKNESKIKIFQKDILNFQAEKKYDLIIASLPFNSIMADKIKKIFAKILSLSNHEAIISFFEYKSIQRFAPLVFSPTRLQEFLKSQEEINKVLASYQFCEKHISFNIPPALVHHLSACPRK